MRYTFHGGGPCDGALNGAVMPDPLSSGSAGQPLSAHAFAIRATAPGSVTRVASPSITTSASRIDTAIEHRGSRATLRPFRVPAPVWNQNLPSSDRQPTTVTCGIRLGSGGWTARSCGSSPRPEWRRSGSELLEQLSAQSTGRQPICLTQDRSISKDIPPSSRGNPGQQHLVEKTRYDRGSHRAYGASRAVERAHIGMHESKALQPRDLGCPLGLLQGSRLEPGHQISGHRPRSFTSMPCALAPLADAPHAHGHSAYVPIGSLRPGGPR